MKLKILWSLFFLLNGLSACLSAQERGVWEKALGETSGLSRFEQNIFKKISNFHLKDRPWGRSVRSYYRGLHNEPDRERAVIILRRSSRNEEKIKGLKAYLEAFFQLPVRIQVVSDTTLPGPQDGKYSAELLPVSYTHLTLPTTPYV